MQKKLLIFALFLTFSLATNLFSKENTNHNSTKNYTPHLLNFGFTVNGNFYFSDFEDIPNCITCAKYDDVKYDFAFGIGYSIFAGYSRELPKFLFDKDFIWTTNLSFTTLSAKYKKESFFSNWIEGDFITQVISSKNLDISLNSIQIKPILSAYLFDKNKLPLRFDFGLNLGILLAGTFDQNEELLQPDAAYFENGTKIRNIASGDLPNKSSVFAGISLGATYDLYRTNNFIFSPKFSLNYGLTNITSDLNWKSHSVNFGVNIAYHIPEKIIPEIIEPTPEPPTVPELPKWDLAEVAELELIVNASHLNNSQINIPVFLDEIRIVNTSLPMIYFEQNSNKIVEGFDRNLIENLRNSNKIVVEIGLSNSENETLFESRKNAIQEFLTKNNITSKTVNFTLNHREKRERHNQIERENAYAKFFINNVFRQIETIKIDTVVNYFASEEISFVTQISVTSHPYSFTFEYFKNDEKLYGGEATDTYSWRFDESIFFNDKNEIETANLTVKWHLQDAENQSKEVEFNYKVVPQITVNTFHNSNPANYFHSEFVVGFFEFDGTELLAVNENSVNKIRQHLRDGGQIEVFGMTDNFGTQNYNQNLSTERAKATIKIIDSENRFSNNILIGSKNKIEQKFDSSNLYNLQKSRVAIVRILK